MTDLEVTRSHFRGIEFDWLLVDKNGQLGLFETAGYGELPDAVLKLGTGRLYHYIDTIEELLKLPEFTVYEEENQGVGTDTDILAYARRGIFVYDWVHWSGPYVRVLRPFEAVDSKLASLLLGLFSNAVPTVYVAFAEVERIYLPDYLDCH